MSFLSETEFRKIIKEEIAVSDVGIKSVSTWTETDTSEANTEITLTHPAEEGKRHYVVGILAGYGEAEGAGEVSFDEGETNKISCYARDTAPLVIILPKPYKAAANTDVSLTVSAGGEGVVGKATLIGFTI
jgi:hypothetical protein